MVLGQIALSINGNLIHNGELINNDKATFIDIDILGNTNINNKITINDPQQGIEIKSSPVLNHDLSITPSISQNNSLRGKYTINLRC